MVEVLIVASIITVSILGIIAVAQKTISLSRQGVHSAQAALLLEEGAEAVKIVRDNGWSNITSLSASTDYYPTFSGGTWTLSATASQVGIFNRRVNIASVNRNASTQDIAASGTDDTGTKLVTVTVSWTEGGTNVSRTLSFYIMDLFS